MVTNIYDPETRERPGWWDETDETDLQNFKAHWKILKILDAFKLTIVMYTKCAADKSYLQYPIKPHQYYHSYKHNQQILEWLLA